MPVEFSNIDEELLTEDFPEEEVSEVEEVPEVEAEEIVEEAPVEIEETAAPIVEESSDPDYSYKKVKIGELVTEAYRDSSVWVFRDGHTIAAKWVTEV